MNRFKDAYPDNAFAVEYGDKSAPTILAKGVGQKARLIIEAAKDANIPVIEHPRLAKLLEGVDINEEIPEALYHSMAVVLSWVFWMRGDKPF